MKSTLYIMIVLSFFVGCAFGQYTYPVKQPKTYPYLIQNKDEVRFCVDIAGTLDVKSNGVYCVITK